jgi:hypothetical protein
VPDCRRALHRHRSSRQQNSNLAVQAQEHRFLGLPTDRRRSDRIAFRKRVDQLAPVPQEHGDLLPPRNAIAAISADEQ